MYQDDAFDWRQRAAMLELQGRDLSDLASALAEHAGYGSNDPFWKISRVLRAMGAARERTAHEIWMTGHETESTVRDEIRSISDEHTDRIVRAGVTAERAAERIERAVSGIDWTPRPPMEPAFSAIVEPRRVFPDARQHRALWRFWKVLGLGGLGLAAYVAFTTLSGPESSPRDHPITAADMIPQREWMAVSTPVDGSAEPHNGGDRNP